jgi:hypothetical protein
VRIDLDPADVARCVIDAGMGFCFAQLLLLHELAHLACANKGHGAEFQQQLVEYVRKYVSITHAAELAQLLK